MKAPKVAAGASPDYSSFVAPQVLPGSYTVKLIVGTKEYTQSLNLVHGSGSMFTEAERQMQFETAMQLYALHEELAALVDSVNVAIGWQKKKAEQEAKPKAKKAIALKLEQLESLKATLVPVKMVSMFADVKRLREELSELYRSVCSGENAPSNLQLENMASIRLKITAAREQYTKLKG
jgi:hypothetical protein